MSYPSASEGIAVKLPAIQRRRSDCVFTVVSIKHGLYEDGRASKVYVFSLGISIRHGLYHNCYCPALQYNRRALHIYQGHLYIIRNLNIRSSRQAILHGPRMSSM